MNFEDHQATLVALGDALRARGGSLATAESCTGGLIAAACTSITGSSDWFERGFVTYSNRAKTEMLGVPGVLIDTHGAVSEDVAKAMAEGALRLSSATIAMAVTGIAGPGGATPAKPVGTVWLAWCARGASSASRLLQLSGSRTRVREQTVAIALQQLVDELAG